MMWWRVLVCSVVIMGLLGPAAHAAEKRNTGEQVLGGVISGLLGQPGQPQDAAFVAQEQERLASLLEGGEYATSRQGEPVDMMILGVPLTHTDHVYTARPIQPSQSHR